MLYLLSLGLSQKNISLEIKEIVKKADLVYLENYTSVYDTSIEELEKIFGKKIIVANRELVENSNEILENAKTKNVAFLVIGDVFAATTHGALFLEAKKQNIPVKVIHSASVFTAVGETGLSLYKFGKTISIPFNYEQTEEPLKILENNLKNNMHTLVLLDLDPSKNKFLNAKEGLQYLLKVLFPECYAVVCCALGTEKQKIFYGKIEDLLKMNFDIYPQCIVIPAADLHFMEKEILELYKINL